MSSSAPQHAVPSHGRRRDAHEKLEALLGSSGDKDAKWGWVVFRTGYRHMLLDSSWKTLETLTPEGLRGEAEGSYAPGVAQRLEWVTFFDESLIDAPAEELERRFRAWVRSRRPRDDGGVPGSSVPLYRYYLHSDADSLDSISAQAQNQATPDWIWLVRAWAENGEDRMRIPVGEIGPALYAKLASDEAWTALYHSGKYDEQLTDLNLDGYGIDPDGSYIWPNKWVDGKIVPPEEQKP
ncbi:hypothetical protein GGTG_11137 [Gaeumannomyces tritici R3-111a-1]|uniref:Uncharacterized protein n=1 Tax=Gaeumannomyces tritici (strain R3-111a-1) TaxID=644352 RepID=J3PCB4_GAET3|nr:hypothetical protein GGTG_11137 [Gaeumannomyces tritici R3-111a-1]EJT71884.1 hypothetical protein GGTG_11137 [Gaeumannomyces tritici R3-111a-1]